jgi:hypothetical protein
VAAEKKAGERLGVEVLDQRANRWVGELHRDDVVLARVLWWRRRARSELPTVSRRRRRSSKRPELWKMKLGCEKMKLRGLESISGSQQCSRGLKLGSSKSESGWRRWTVGRRRSGESSSSGNGKRQWKRSVTRVNKITQWC